MTANYVVLVFPLKNKGGPTLIRSGPPWFKSGLLSLVTGSARWWTGTPYKPRLNGPEWLAGAKCSAAAEMVLNIPPYLTKSPIYFGGRFYII